RRPDVEGVAGGKIEHRREIGQVASPVRPGGNEAGEIAKSTFAPDVNSAFVGIARRELDYRERQRRVENKPRADPDDDGTGAGRGRRRNPAQADAGDHVEQNQVAESHDPLWLVGIVDLSARSGQAPRLSGDGFEFVHYDD